MFGGKQIGISGWIIVRWSSLRRGPVDKQEDQDQQDQRKEEEIEMELI